MDSRHVSVDPDRLGVGHTTELGVDDIGGPYSAYLLRPYLDLSPFEAGPSFATSVESAYGQLEDDASPRLMIQTHPAPTLRDALVRETGLPAYRIRYAADLPERLRTPRWRFLLEMIAVAQRRSRLSVERQVRLATLLNTLGLYHETARLFVGAADDVSSSTSGAATLAIRYAMAVHRTQRSPEAERLNLRVLAQAAEDRHGDLYVRLGASTTLIACYAKGRNRDPGQVRHWRTVAEGLYPSLTPESGLPDVLYASTYWRAVSFARYIEKDFAGTAAELDEAERYALAFQPSTGAERMVWWQNMHPLLETRAREAFDAGDPALAERRSTRLLELDPLCAKSHGHMGNLRLAAGAPEEARAYFRSAIELGAPYTSFAWFMLGHCAQMLGDQPGAYQAFVDAVRSDPGNIDARRRLESLRGSPRPSPARTGPESPLAGLSTWAGSSLGDIAGRLRAARAGHLPQPHLEAPA